MSYQDLLDSFSEKETTLDEDVENWKKISPSEKAKMIEEVKKKGTDAEKARLLEVAEKAKANTEAGGTGTQTGDEILSKKDGTGDTEWKDTDSKLSDRGKMAAASGIGAGLGALNIAKKLRRTQSAESTDKTEKKGE